MKYIKCTCKSRTFGMSSQAWQLKHDPALIQKALEQVSSGQSLNSVAKAAGIPETIVRHYKLKSELVGHISGPKPLLTDEEEVGLATAALAERMCTLSGYFASKTRCQKLC